MKIFSLIAAGLVAACMAAFSAPAMAATSLLDTVQADFGLATAASDCLASFDTSSAIVFVEATRNCDAVMAELSGLCLQPASGPLPSRIVAVLDPGLDLTCITNIDTGPPG